MSTNNPIKRIKWSNNTNDYSYKPEPVKFIPSDKFNGSISGYIFQMGQQGLGYYLDNYLDNYLDKYSNEQL